jgi:hypothetical protein
MNFNSKKFCYDNRYIYLEKLHDMSIYYQLWIKFEEGMNS